MVKEFTNPPATTTSNDTRIDAIEATLTPISYDGEVLNTTHDIVFTDPDRNIGYITSGPTYAASLRFRGHDSFFGPNVGVFANDNLSYIFEETQLRPNPTGTVALGTSQFRWSTPYSVNALNTSSDERKKKNIKPCNLGMNFIKRLKPVCYEYDNIDKDGHTRLGFLAQDVQKALKAYGNMGDNAMLQEDENEEDPEHPWLSMAYTELLAPMVAAMQDLEKEVSKLKKEVASLKKDKK